MRKLASIRSRGIITEGGMSRSPLATRGSIMAGVLPKVSVSSVWSETNPAGTSRGDVACPQVKGPQISSS